MIPKSIGNGPVGLVIACEVMRLELETAAQGFDVTFVFLEQGLHRTPDRLPVLIQAEINKASDNGRPIGLGYGLCSNGLLGIKAGPGGLVMGRCHDCIALLMGSPAEYKRRFDARPGTFYLSQGWVALGKEPLKVMEEEYYPKYGKETSEWVMTEEIKHYTHFGLIDTGVGDLEAVRERVQANCRHFGKKFEAISSSINYFQRLIAGPWEGPDFLCLEPGQTIEQDMFF